MRTNTLRTALSSNAKIPVAILARNSLANAYLIKLLQKEPRIRLLSSPPSPRNGHGTKPVVFVLPVEPPFGVAQAGLLTLRRSFPRSRFLLAGPRPTADQILELLRAGAHGFVAADKIESQLLPAIKEVWSGNIWLISQDFAPKNRPSKAPQRNNADPEMPLTQRQTETAELVRSGLSNKQIASEIGISERTVKFHLRNVFLRLGVTDHHALSAALATQRGTTGPPQPARRNEKA